MWVTHYTMWLPGRYGGAHDGWHVFASANADMVLQGAYADLTQLALTDEQLQWSGVLQVGRRRLGK